MNTRNKLLELAKLKLNIAEAMLTVEQLQALTIWQIQCPTLKQMKNFTVEELQGLKVWRLQDLTIDQLQSLKSCQKQFFTEAKIKLIDDTINAKKE